jgi:2-dehydropantoate 2-reductase
MTPRVLVLGTGALASLVGGRLAHARVASVTLQGSWHAALEAIARDGLAVDDDGQHFTVAVGVCHNDQTPPPADIVLVLVKSLRTEVVAHTAARASAPAGIVVTLQNGLGNAELLERAAPGRVARGATTSAALLLAPGVVRGSVGDTWLDNRGAPLARLFEAASMPVHTDIDVDTLLWRKLVATCAILPLTALHGVANGALAERPELRAVLCGVAREVAAVAQARGIVLPADAAALALDVASRTATNRSSMLRDLERGAPTEIDALCGAVAQEGMRLGVATPLNLQLWREVREREGRGACLADIAFREAES